MNVKKNKNETLLHFNNDEAIVFYNWLVNFNQKNVENCFEDQSEQRILWDLESSLESEMTEIFQNNYKELVLKAQSKLRDEE